MEFNRESFENLFDYHLKKEGGAKNENSYKANYNALAATIADLIREDWSKSVESFEQKDIKVAYYLSVEFLMGRALGNNLMNMGILNEINDFLKERGLNLNKIEEEESDAGLGNGGLGRLAACFLESIATLKLPAMGYSLLYEYGIFKQKFDHGNQIELADDWLREGSHWISRVESESVKVCFGGKVHEHGRLTDAEEIIAVPYDMPVVGFNSNYVATLRLWKSECLTPFDLALFNQEKYSEAVASATRASNITRVLYPNDNGKEGKIVRLKQEYLFASASLQDILRRYKKKYNTQYEAISSKIAIQLNDTHPVIAIPELMRLLVDIEGLDWDRSWDITKKTFAYSNHTILSEALETWEVSLFQPILPRIYQIINEINHRFLTKLRKDLPTHHEKAQKMSIIHDGKIHMARLALAGSFSVNGVAELHTNIIKSDLFKDWYELWPQRFNNKTNGVTPRRWLLKCNPELSQLITEKIGTGWTTDLKLLEKLKDYIDDNDFLNQLLEIKKCKKAELAEIIKERSGLIVNNEAIFDVQVKRLHEYKRQLLNALHIIYLYKKLKAEPNKNFVPRLFIFGAKAASGYYMAKKIIKLINDIANKVNSDPDIAGRLQVIFLENYNVSLAEKIIPAADISEQISTAGKEASGTGNMKFMINGAITMGTLDGANIEIVEEAGKENEIIFGLKAEEITQIWAEGSNNPVSVVNNDPELKEVMSSLTDNTFNEAGTFQDIYNSLLSGSHPDNYLVLTDFRAYVEAQEKAANLFSNKTLWQKMSLMNIASCGKFSSDRTIKEYANDIWNIEQSY